MMPEDFIDEVGAPPILPRRHDHACELTKPKSWFGPPVGTCWCDVRAEGYVTWLGQGGAGKVEFTATSQEPPNMGGVA